METKKTRRTYSTEFKMEAARRVIEQKEKAAAVAQELHISVVSLYQWMKDYEQQHNQLDLESAISSTLEDQGDEKKDFVQSQPAQDLFSEMKPSKESDILFGKPFMQSIQQTKNENANEAQAPVTQLSKDSDRAVNKQEKQKNFIARESSIEDKKPDTPQQPQQEPIQISKPEQPVSPQTKEARQNDGQRSNGERKDRKEARDFERSIRPNKNYEVPEEDFYVEKKPEPPQRLWPKPTAAQGRSWKVMHALDQRPNYREENARYGYVDEFNVPAQNLEEVWAILEIMQEKTDKRAFDEMVHIKGISVPQEILDNPRLTTIQGPVVPNKPWLRKPRMNSVAEGFFQTTPDYQKSVYETFDSLVIRLDKNSEGTPILEIQRKLDGSRDITIDFSRFDRFVDDFYGDFVGDCKQLLMQLNPKEYPSLNAFIRIPDEPLWNPKLWAGVRTFNWKPNETLPHAWLRYAQNLRKNLKRERF